MNQKLMTDLGENYEYIRTYVSNHIELKKLELIEKLASLSGSIISWIIISMVGLTGTLFLLVGLTILTAQWLDSYLYAVLIIGTILLLICLIIFIMRKKWIKIAVADALFKKLMDIE